MAEATEYWIEGGLVNGRSVLKAGASIGEGQLLGEEEWCRLIETVVRAARDRVPVLGAIHHKDTVRTVEDARRASDAGAIGLQVSPPIFNLPTQDDILRYYGAVSEQIDLGIVVYVTPGLPHGSVFPKTLARMADFEKVVGIKWSPPDGVDFESAFELTDRFVILDNNGQPWRSHQLGGRGFLVDGVEAYPPFWLNIWDRLEAGDYEGARSEWERFHKPFAPFFAKVLSRSGSDAKVAKAMSKIMGMDLGPPRPPSLPLDEEELRELRAMMMDWGWPVA